MKTTLSLALISAVSATALWANEPIWDANKVQLESQKLAEGVFAVIPVGADEMAKQGYPIATTAGFVIGDDAVLIIERMLNERLQTQMMDLVRAQTDLPIRYVVNTSYHGDHQYGNQYLPDGVTIIQHEHTAEFIPTHIDADKAFMMQNFGTGRGIEDIVATAADVTVSTGGSMTVHMGTYDVSIRDYGFAQTGGDLFVSIPEANVVWTGNAIPAEPPALPWLLDGHLADTRDTFTKVAASINDDTKVVPGHGPVTDKATIEWQIAYLNEVEKQVRAAKAEGLTLEEVQQKVTMDAYQGYALFPWVHPGLNIPAAYAEN